MEEQTTKHILEAKAFNKKAGHEIAEILPSVKKDVKKFVQGIGHVHYLYDDAGISIAHAFKDQGRCVLLVKNNKVTQ